VFHNTLTAIPKYTELEAYQKVALTGKVEDLSCFTHELRWVKSPSELKLMRDSASIVCQVLITCYASLMESENKRKDKTCCYSYAYYLFNCCQGSLANDVTFQDLPV